MIATQQHWVSNPQLLYQSKTSHTTALPVCCLLDYCTEILICRGYCLSIKFCLNDSFRKLFLFFENTFQYLGGISQEISVSHFDSRRSLSSANRRRTTSPILFVSFTQPLWSAWQEDPTDPQERCAMARTSCAGLKEINFCVRICYMFLISTCRGDWDLGLCTFWVLSKREVLSKSS